MRLQRLALACLALTLGGCPGFGDPAPDTAPAHPGYNPDIALLIDAHCAVCHSSPPQNGAPAAYNFTQYQDTSPTVYGVLTMCCDISNVTRTGYMPPASQPPLSPADRETFTRWGQQGCPSDENGPALRSPPCP